jgi:hypothetical protein
MRHKWAEIIKAWADGATILYRECMTPLRGPEWGAWKVLPDDRAPMRTDMYIEYRVEPVKPPHKWQHEKEAFLAGRPVEFRMVGQQLWHKVDGWVVDDCVKKQSPPIPIWDRDWLEFRLPSGVPA